jgi:hypothetical protein
MRSTAPAGIACRCIGMGRRPACRLRAALRMAISTHGLTENSRRSPRLGTRHPIVGRSAIALSDYRQSPIAFFARDAAPAIFDYFVNVFSEGEGRRAISIREFQPSGTGDDAAIVAEVSTGHLVGWGTPATLASNASHLRILPFEPGLTVPTYVSWRAGRSTVVDAFAEHMSELA